MRVLLLVVVSSLLIPAMASAEPPSQKREQYRSAQCANAREGLRWYVRWTGHWRLQMGARPGSVREGASCPRYLAKVWRSKARAARHAYGRWLDWHWNWREWLPATWYRIGSCETGYGGAPNWRHNSGAYQGAFGFAVSSWDQFRLPGYPSEAYLASPRQQYEVALAIWRRFGFSGWGCKP